MKDKIFVLILFFSIVLHFLGINWGTPSTKKTLQIFNSFDELKEYVPTMVELRKKFYSSIKKIHTEGNIEKTIEETYAHQLKSQPFGELSKETKLDAMRGYFLGSINSDEQRNIVVVSNMNPVKFDFNPNDFTYGGIYFYLVASSFVVGKILGVVSLTKDIQYYFFHPEEVANMYIIMRCISAISVILTIVFLYRFAKKYFNKNIGVLSCIFVCILPLVIANSKMSKPHTLGMFLVLLGTYFAYKNFESDEIKNYILSGLFLGLSFGVLYTNFVSILILYLVVLTKNNFKLKPLFNKKVFIATGIFLGIFLITNWYIIADFDKFLRRKQELAIIFHYGDFDFIESLKFLKEFFSTNVPLILLPIIIYGFYLIFKNKEKKFYLLAIFIIIHFIFLVIYLKHPNVFIISLPYLAVICGYSIQYFLVARSIVLKIYLFIVILFLTLNAVFQSTFFVKYGNLTKAGEWINKNIPQDSSINVNNGWFCVGDYPAFNFLKYNLIVACFTYYNIETSFSKTHANNR